MGPTRTCLPALVMVCGISSVWANDTVQPTQLKVNPPTAVATSAAAFRLDASTPNSARKEDLKPWIHDKMPTDVRSKLEAGFELALQRISAVPECRALFVELGADPFETLRTGLYFPVHHHFRAKTICGRNAAYTYVGAASTFVCRDFARMSDKRAAMYVIHEALHHAGLSERPHDPAARTSSQINAMVVTKCRF